MQRRYIWIIPLSILILLLAFWGWQVRANQVRSTPPPIPLPATDFPVDKQGKRIVLTKTPNPAEIKNMTPVPFPKVPTLPVVDIAPEKTGVAKYDIAIIDKNGAVRFYLRIPQDISEDEIIKEITGKYYFPKQGDSYMVVPPAPQFNKIRERQEN